jgi:hypothetical protein
MKFYKATNRDHVHHELPTVLWDPEKDKAKFEFSRGSSGLLEFDTDDPNLIEELKGMGYGYEIEEPASPPTVKTVVMQEDRPISKKKHPASVS